MAKFLPAVVRRRMKTMRKPTIPVVRMSGVIGRGSRFEPGLSLASVEEPLKRAFAMKRAPAVAICLNSPGGSPVQASLIEKYIRALSAQHKKDVLIFVEDVAASGGYWIACAGDEIFADASSIIGSIGVVSAGFGFTDAMAKLGVERRVYTAGERKVTLDPFQPSDPDDVAHLKQLQQAIHQEFIDLVKDRRGDKLADDADIFSGLFWAGRQALDLGLIDAIGDMQSVLKERYGEDVTLKVINRKRGLLSRGISTKVMFDLSKWDRSQTEQMASGLTAGALQTLEDRTLWQRYGL